MIDTLAKQDGSYVSYDYSELVTSRGAEILAMRSDDDYQGDTFYLLRDGDRYGYLVVGWGSCSGCDALQAACDVGYESVRVLRDELIEQIIWGTKDEIRAHIESRRAGNDFYVGGDRTFESFQRVTAEALR